MSSSKLAMDIVVLLKPEGKQGFLRGRRGEMHI